MIPTSAVDLFDDEALDDPYPRYRALRELGPVVHLTRHDVYAVSRYDDVRRVLGDPATFCSGQGVGLNDFVNVGGRGTTLMTDGAEHARQREVIGRPMTPRALAALRTDVQDLADDLVDRLVEKRSFDAVPDLAEVIPGTWVPDLLGWPADGREQLIAWGSANFDLIGPLNERAERAGPLVLDMVSFAERVAVSGDVPPGSMAAGVLDAAARGDVDPARVPMLLIDYIAPSLDTTISALGNAVWLFATNPDQWDLVRADSGIVAAAFNEVLRVESPINCFTRVATTDADIGGVPVAAGSRVLVLYASANRDERRWERPDELDVTRQAAAQLAFGHGPHACAGMGLARLEGHAVLTALARTVARFELGTAVRKRNNLIRSFASLPVTVTPA